MGLNTPGGQAWYGQAQLFKPPAHCLRNRRTSLDKVPVSCHDTVGSPPPTKWRVRCNRRSASAGPPESSPVSTTRQSCACHGLRRAQGNGPHPTPLGFLRMGARESGRVSPASEIQFFPLGVWRALVSTHSWLDSGRLPCQPEESRSHDLPQILVCAAAPNKEPPMRRLEQPHAHAYAPRRARRAGRSPATRDPALQPYP